MLALTILYVSFFLSFVHASPVMIRDVFDPHITSPNASTVWPVGTTQTVTWETDDIPPDSQLTDVDGMVVLGFLGSDGGLNLDIDNPLAQNFPLHAGEVQITVPNVTPKDDYIIVLFGDSGNSSPAFAITRITNSTTSTTQSSSQTSTTTHAATVTATSASSTLVIKATSTSSSVTGAAATSNELSASTTDSLPPSSASSSPTSTQTTPTSSLAVSSTSAAIAAASTTSNSAWAKRPATALSFGAVSLLLTLLV